MYEIINNTKENVEIEEIDKYLKYLVKKLKLKGCLFNIVIVDDKIIRELNKEYRSIDKETDVISFALEDNQDYSYIDFRVLGDIYISLDTSKRQALEFNHPLIKEIYFLITHGVLHLLGYDHINEKEEKKMFLLQYKLIDKYKEE